MIVYRGDTEAVNAKERDLMVPVLGRDKTAGIIEIVNTLETIGDIRHLSSLLAA